MSGIAHILMNFGYNISGSDISDSEILHKLSEAGAKIYIGVNENNVIKSNLVVYTAAISNDNPELLKAQELNIPVIERADFLGELTKLYKETISISGTHGKTTTTSMVSLCFIEAMLDPTIQVGSTLKQLNGNFRIGNSKYFIIEACEYVESFLKFNSKSEIILNIEADHLDYYKDIEHIKSAFTKFINLLPTDGLLVINNDDINCVAVSKSADCKVVTYGINTPATWVAKNILFDKNSFGSFDAYYNDTFFEKIELSVPGIHNVSNALACIALCNEYSIKKETIKSGMLKFTGADRRFEYKGSFNNISIFDDYAHHPTEILATLNSLKNKEFNKLWIIFQPHTYTRTKALLNDFAKVFLDCDNILITDIYAAREKNPGDISSKDLVEKIKDLGKDCIYMSNFNDIVEHITKNAECNDIIVTVGAGTVTEIGPMILKQFS